jgi:hypothetical protein
VPAAVSGQRAATIEDLAGMAGCWERSTPNSVITEQWMKPAGNSMIGMGRTVRNGKTTGYEFMRLEARSDGIYFVALPRENAVETAFKLIRSTSGEFVFENPEHDFPQRVIYRIDGDRLSGRIEGNNKGKPMSIDFPYKRTACV